MTKKSSSPTSMHLYAVLVVLTAAIVALSAYIVRMHTVTTEASELRSQVQTSPSECNTSESPIINVTQKVDKSIDSGEAGNYWAFDSFNRKIQVWKQTDGTYCALVDYEGKFDAQAGQQSPGNTAVLTGKEDGNFKGGYRAVINGNLKATPDLTTKGSIGTASYNCDLSGNCPGAFNWTEKYFNTAATGYSFSYSWWGWEYKVGTKVWVNSSDGNTGDIL
jgi:hypothetical protein